jgi:thiol-disulfide isomerase/thioredoxin
LIAALFAPLAFANAAEVKPFVRGSWRAIVEQHAGQPIIVHFWGLTCGPCRHEMPEWGRLFAQTPDLRLITINADAVQSAPEAIQDFLDKSGLAGAENWNFDDGFGERLRYEIDPKWQGEIPITLLIGRDGGTRRIEGAAEMAEVRSWFEGQASTK